MTDIVSGTRLATDIEVPGIKMICNGYEGRSLHDNVLAVEDPLPAVAVHDPVLLSVDPELVIAGECLNPETI